MDNPYDIALDVDGVLADFQSAFLMKAAQTDVPFYQHYTEWDGWDPEGEKAQAFEEVDLYMDRDFWLFLVQPLHKAHVPYEVEAYVSARSHAPDGVTKEWLDMHGYPEAPVYVVEDSDEKLDVLREDTDADVFVDDKIATVRHFQRRYTDHNDVPLPILMTAPHNSPHGRDDTKRIWNRAHYLNEVPTVTKRFLANRPYRSQHGSIHSS